MPQYRYTTTVKAPTGAALRFDSDATGTAPAVVYANAQGAPIDQTNPRQMIHSDQRDGSIQAVFGDAATVYIRQIDYSGNVVGGVIATITGAAPDGQPDFLTAGIRKAGTATLGGSASLFLRDTPLESNAPTLSPLAATAAVTLSSSGQTTTTIASGQTAATLVAGPAPSNVTFLRCDSVVQEDATGYFWPDWKTDSRAISATNNQANMPSWSLLVGTDAVNFEVALRPSGSGGFAYRWWIDGLPLTASPVLPVVTNNNNYTLKLTLPARGVAHRVELEMYRVAVNNIFIDGWASMWAEKPRGPRVMIFGDSFVQGSSQNLGGELGTCLTDFAKLSLGCEDVWLAGTGSTGFLNNAGATVTAAASIKSTYRQRVAEITAAQPDLVILYSTYNDNSIVEVHDIKASGTVSGGTWSYTPPGGTPITGLAFNVSTASLQTSIQAQIASVTVAGTAGAEYMIRFPKAYGAAASIGTVDSSGITGGGSYGQPTRVQAGGITGQAHATEVGLTLDAIKAGYAGGKTPAILVVGKFNQFDFTAYENKVAAFGSGQIDAPDDLLIRAACQARLVPYIAPSTGKVWDGAGNLIATTGGWGTSANATTPVTVTAATGVFTWPAVHGLAVGDLVPVKTISGITGGIAAATVYWVVSVPSSTTATVAASQGGTAITAAITVGGTAFVGNMVGSDSIHPPIQGRRIAWRRLVQAVQLLFPQ